MRKIANYLMLGLLTASVVACQKDKAFEQEETISQEVISKLSELGFGTKDLKKIDGGYLVEGDILITENDLRGTPDRILMRIAEVEQYHTFNLVSPRARTLTVRTASGVPAEVSTALDAALARYNAEPLTLKFSRVSTSSADITIQMVTTNQYIASAGFPTSSGNPHGTVNYSTNFVTNYSQGFITTVLAHEIGHCIGFRHTDYMRRAYSCGSGGNEGQTTTGIGAVLIPGTPSGPDPNSWMLACLSSTTNRPFNANDKIALAYVY